MTKEIKNQIFKDQEICDTGEGVVYVNCEFINCTFTEYEYLSNCYIEFICCEFKDCLPIFTCTILESKIDFKNYHTPISAYCHVINCDFLDVRGVLFKLPMSNCTFHLVYGCAFNANLRWCEFNEVYSTEFSEDISIMYTSFGNKFNRNSIGTYEILDMFQITNSGSRNDNLTVFKTENDIFVRTGCFTGNLKDFHHQLKTQVRLGHNVDSYNGVVDYISKRCGMSKLKFFLYKGTK